MWFDRLATDVYPGRMNQKVDDVQFVTAWMKCATVAEVSHHTGLTPNSVRSRACQLRKKGVKLPPKARQRKPVDVAQLNDLVQQFKSASAGESGDTDQSASAIEQHKKSEPTVAGDSASDAHSDTDEFGFSGSNDGLGPDDVQSPVRTPESHDQPRRPGLFDFLHSLKSAPSGIKSGDSAENLGGDVTDRP